MALKFGVFTYVGAPTNFANLFIISNVAAGKSPSFILFKLSSNQESVGIVLESRKAKIDPLAFLEPIFLAWPGYVLFFCFNKIISILLFWFFDLKFSIAISMELLGLESTIIICLGWIVWLKVSEHSLSL